MPNWKSTKQWARVWGLELFAVAVAVAIAAFSRFGHLLGGVH